MPLSASALTDGMLSENWSALRRRSGPRSSWSKSVGVNLPKSVVTSMNMVDAVKVLSLMPVA